VRSQFRTQTKPRQGASCAVWLCVGQTEALSSALVDTRGRRFWAIAGALLALWAAGIRINNAILFPLHYGFDATANWDYIARLLTSWELPDPSEGWSTAHPPLFYYLSALLGRSLGGIDKQAITIAVRLISSAMGLGGIALAVAWVRHRDP
jgi:hypothetical protein